MVGFTFVIRGIAIIPKIRGIITIENPKSDNTPIELILFGRKSIKDYGFNFSNPILIFHIDFLWMFSDIVLMFPSNSLMFPSILLMFPSNSLLFPSTLLMLS